MGLRVQEEIVAIAVYGSSCTGKSVVAEELSCQLNTCLRQCGKILSAELLAIGVAANDPMAVAIHERIDEETRSAARDATQLIIIEGRFLDIVLRGIPKILFVKLICEFDVRSRRMQERGSVINMIADSDYRDDELVQSLYSGSNRGSTEDLHIDTTSMTVEDIAATIIRECRERMGI